MLTAMGNESGDQAPEQTPDGPAVATATPGTPATTESEAKSGWSSIPLWGRIAMIAAPILIATIILIVVLVNARPSLDSVASDCGGRGAGIHVDESGMLIDMSHGADALICVLPKVLADKSEQYAVALASDDGDSSTLTLSGREFKFGTLDGARFVFIGNP